jgi:hypothetical protein
MGIRYYAYPLADEHVRFAREDPRAFFSKDPFVDAWGLVPIDPETGHPIMLYLDKCWRELQSLFGDGGPDACRPAYQLVHGQVTMTSEGWWPHFGVLDAAQVAEVSADLATVTENHVDAWLRDAPPYPDHDEKGYVMDFLGRAQAFAALMASKDLALIYMIG